MSLSADRMTKAVKARRFRPGHEPEWIAKAWTFNDPDDASLPSAEQDEPVELGGLEEGDAFAFADGSGHGIVTGRATGLAMTRIEDGAGHRYVPPTTPVIRSAPLGGVL